MNIINIGLRLISAGIFIVGAFWITLLLPWLLVFLIPITFIGLEGINANREDEDVSS